MRVRVAHSVAELEDLRSEWQDIYQQSPHFGPRPTFFQSFGWNLLAAQTFPHQVPYVVVASCGSARVLVPAAVHRAFCLTLVGEAMSDYRDVLVCGDEAEIQEALAAAWQELARLRLPFSVPAVRNDSRLVAEGAAEQLGAQPFVGAPWVDSSRISASGYVGYHSRVASRLRRLERAGAKLTIRSGNHAALVRWIYEEKARQFTGQWNNLFADRRRIDFMVAACALPELNCEIFCFEAAGELISAAITFRDERVRSFYNIYFNGKWAHYSPGVMLVFEVTRRTLAEGLDADYLTGEQPHKLRLANAAAQLYRIDAPAEALAALAARRREQVAA
jgi:CelD/BcsL family acetyltransferase involved in cellulose biosynthesis